MAGTKKVGRPRKKATTKKKEVEEFPVDEVIAEMKGVLLTENENTKKKDELKAAKEEERKAVLEEQENETETATFADELLENNINPEGDIEAVETVNIDEIVKETADELREEVKEETVVEIKEEEKPINTEPKIVLNKPKPRKITVYRQLGQIIDY